MNMLFINYFCEGFMISEIPRVSVFGYFPLYSTYKLKSKNEKMTVKV